MDTQEQASIFLMQATLGADQATLDRVTQQGIEGWLEAQLNNAHVASDSYQQTTQEIWQFFRTALIERYGDQVPKSGDAALPYWFYWRQAWWQRTLNKGRLPNDTRKEFDDKDLVRHRVAQALSELLVISDNSNLQLDAVAMASYYDIFYRHAFGRYKDILQEVSLHPCMGVYLSHLNNRKADPSQNIHPDENYAREIMQLFSIGLFELNADGTRKKDSSGRDIPSYDNRDIKALARVFTGLKARAYQYEWTGLVDLPTNGTPVLLGDGVNKSHKTVPYVDMVSPMAFDEAFHDTDEKRLLNGRIQLPAGQSTEKDIQDTVAALVAHPNTAPFIARRLIQQLTSSNPSTAYVKSVAEKFGTSGDMKALVREILLHPEARKGVKLKSSVLRTTQILRAFRANNTSGRLWLLGDRIKYKTQQHVLSSPTVFNFYTPDFVPHGEIEKALQVAPEFALHNAATSIDWVNLMYEWFFGETLPVVSTVLSASKNNRLETDWNTLTQRAGYVQDKLRLDTSAEESLASSGQYEALVQRVSLLLTGRKQHPNQQDIINAFDSYKDNAKWVVQTVLFMVAISPEFNVLGEEA